MRAFVVTLLVLIVGLFVGLALLDLGKILVFIRAGGFADWSEFDLEAERLSIEVRVLSREDLAALIEGSTRDIPTTEHRSLHQSVHMAAYHSVLRLVAETEQVVGKKGISDPISIPS